MIRFDKNLLKKTQPGFRPSDKNLNSLTSSKINILQQDKNNRFSTTILPNNKFAVNKILKQYI